MAQCHSANLAQCLFLCGPYTRNGFYIFKWLNKNQKNIIPWHVKIREIHTSEPTPRGFLEHRLPCVVHVPPAAASRLRGKDRAWPGLTVLAVQPSAGKAPAPGMGAPALPFHQLLCATQLSSHLQVFDWEQSRVSVFSQGQRGRA